MGKSIITVKDIARELGVSERTARRYRAGLRKAKVLTPITRGGRRTAGDMAAVKRAVLSGRLARGAQ